MVKAVLAVLIPLLAALSASGEDARLPYHQIYSMEKVQLDLSRQYTNLALVLEMRSTLLDVKATNITASIESHSGVIPVSISAEGAFVVPMRDDLLAEDPWINVNQPKGTMQLNWHAGLSPTLARQLTNSIHYGFLMRTVRECDYIQDAMRQFFPAAPRLSAVGLRLVFHASALAPAAIIQSKTGIRRLSADTLGELIIPIDEDLMAEDPIMVLTDAPVTVEIVTRKDDGHP